LSRLLINEEEPMKGRMLMFQVCETMKRVGMNLVYSQSGKATVAEPCAVRKTLARGLEMRRG